MDTTKADLAERAAIFARKAHRASSQTRKYTGEPYENHLSEVAELVSRVSDSTPEMIAAAWLHDTIEDTSTSVQAIKKNFGPKIAILVQELTDVSSKEDGNRNRRKEIDRFHLAQASPEAKTVKLADLVSNAESIIKHDEKFARVFVNEMKLLLQVLREGDKFLWARAKKMVDSYMDTRALIK